VYHPRSCVGAYLFDQSTGWCAAAWRRRRFSLPGDLAQIFLRTSNPAGARGDGVAMAERAGARVINMEFVQFHPTTFHFEHARIS